MEDARDEGRRGVDELQMRLELVIVFWRRLGACPEEGIVVGEGGEEDAQEEEHGCEKKKYH